jgi:hypothetical protein
MSSPITFSFGGGGPPSPFKFSSLPGSSGSPVGGGLPGTDQHLQAFQVAAMNSPDLAGILGTIKNAGGDVIGAITSVLPKNADGSVNWGAVGSDLVGFIKDHGKDILSGLTAYENYSRRNKADQLGQQALKDAETAYNAPGQVALRTAGTAGMLDPSAKAPDLTRLGTMATAGQGLAAPQPIPLGQSRANLSTVAGSGSGNPFAKALPMAPPPTAPSLPTPATPAPYLPSKPQGAIPMAGGPVTPGTPPVAPSGPVGGPPTPPAMLPPGARNAPALASPIPLAPQAPTPPTIGGIKPLLMAPYGV